MRLTIKNVEVARVNLGSQSNRLDVDIAGIEIEDLLNHVDIVVAITYYGITELLDTIGRDNIQLYLNME